MAGGRFWTTGELDRLTAMVGRFFARELRKYSGTLLERMP